jgi:hypothetical protein
MSGLVGTVVVGLTGCSVYAFAGVDVADLVGRTIPIVGARRWFFVGVVRNHLAIWFTAVDFFVTAVGFYDLAAIAIVGTEITNVTVLVFFAFRPIIWAAR